MKRAERVVKRILDYTVSLFLIILLSPLMLLIAVLIKLTSAGPVFFRQQRLGEHGKTFSIYKFRTMIDGAEHVGTGLSTSKRDPRVTRVGYLLRRTSLDELPQLLNILKGEMSLIGPRPPVPYHPHKYDEYTPEQRLRFTVPPGITGYAQVKGRNILSWPERIAYDVEYVKNWSLLLDMWIFVKTLSVLADERVIFSPEKRTQQINQERES